jgi:hypothetical protein
MTGILIRFRPFVRLIIFRTLEFLKVIPEFGQRNIGQGVTQGAMLAPGPCSVGAPRFWTSKGL